MTTQVAGGGFLRSLNHRLLVRVARARVTTHLRTDGLALIGKDPTPLSSSRAAELVAQVDDDMIMHAATLVGLPAEGPGSLGGLFQDLINWIATHQDQIMALVKMIMALIALFG